MSVPLRLQARGAQSCLFLVKDLGATTVSMFTVTGTSVAPVSTL